MSTNPCPDIHCISCGDTPDMIDEYVMAARSLHCSPWEYVQREEGTYNIHNGHFLCTECYLAAGCPSSPTGWVAP
jgi:hypothetical protein